MWSSEISQCVASQGIRGAQGYWRGERRGTGRHERAALADIVIKPERGVRHARAYKLLVHKKQPRASRIRHSTRMPLAYTL